MYFRKISILAALLRGPNLLYGTKSRRLPASSFHVNCSDSQTLKEISKTWLQRLKQNRVPDAESSVIFITEHVLGKDNARDHSVTKDKRLTEEEVGRINQLCRQRLQRVPVQYVIGEWDFRDLTLNMRPPVFIPRPETEELVDLVAKHHNLACAEERFSFLEIGCGSGAICLSLLSEFPQASCVAIDKSKEAVNLTMDNAQRCHVSDRLCLHHADIRSLLTVAGSMKFDAIISNPPYIPEQDMALLQPEISKHEDKGALFGGPDGLDVVKEILRVSSRILKPRGSVWLEVDTVHPRLIQSWISESDLGLEYCTTFNDFTQRPRFCHIIRAR